MQNELAVQGYEVFFHAFVLENSTKFIEYSNFVHKHFDNPWVLDEPVIAEYEDGQMVAMHWLMGMPMLCNGEPVMLARGADYAAMPGKHGLAALKVLRDSKKSLERQGIPLFFSDPNENSEAIQSRMGCQKLGTFVDYTVQLDTLQKPASSASNEIESYATCPFDDADFERMNEADDTGPYDIKPFKNNEYYQWRVDSLPGRSFDYRVLRAKGALAGFLLIENKGRMSDIVDWGVFGDAGAKADTLGALLNACADSYDTLKLGMVNPESAEKGLLESCGFTPRCNAEGEQLGCTMFAMPSGIECDPGFFEMSSWSLRPVDNDWFLNCYGR